jgi:hypothetical protein
MLARSRAGAGESIQRVLFAISKHTQKQSPTSETMHTYRIARHDTEHHFRLDGTGSILIFANEIVFALVDFGDFSFVRIEIQNLIPDGCLGGIDVLNAKNASASFRIVRAGHGLFRDRFSLIECVFVLTRKFHVFKGTRIVGFKDTTVWVRRVAILAGCAALAVVPEEHQQEGECGGTTGAEHLI